MNKKGISNYHKYTPSKKIEEFDKYQKKKKNIINLSFHPIDKTIIRTPKQIEQMIKDEKINLSNLKITLQKDNYRMQNRNLDGYDDFNKLREIYKKLKKLLEVEISEEGWYKINKLFDGKKNKEIYTKNHMINEI